MINCCNLLKDLIQNSTNSEELISFGCTIPNCMNTVWSEAKSELYSYGDGSEFYDYQFESEIYQYFANKEEVYYRKMF